MERHNFQDPGVDRTGRIYGAMDPLYHPVFFQVYPGTVPLYAKLTGKNIVYSHIPLIARMEAHSIDKKLIAGCDMLFFSGGSQVLSRIETDKPVFYLSDATFELMVDYYWPNLAACSVRYGNSIEQRALDKASVIIHSSEWASNSARDYYHIPASKLNVIEFGANIDENKIQTPVKQEFAGGGVFAPHTVFRGRLGAERRRDCCRYGHAA